MEGHPPHHHLQLSSYLQIHQYGAAANVDAAAVAGDRFPQWSIQETRDMLVVRAGLEPAFVDAKRPNKLLWEAIATKMKEKGYNRSAGQCKSMWKNLVVRYKGCESMEQEEMRQQYPFYDDLRAIFAARMDRILSMEAEDGGGTSSKKRSIGAAALSSDDDEETEISDGEVKGGGNGRRKIIKKRKATKDNNNSESNGNSLKEIVEEFTKQQLEMEMQWKRAYEEREEERRVREIEWRKMMEALQKERLMMERQWREREEQRRVREEARAETRDALINALLNKLRTDDII